MRNRSSDASIRRSIAGTGSPGDARGRRGTPVIAVLRRLLAAAHRLDRRAEAVHLPAGVVVVVLARDVVAGELEQPRDRVAVRAVTGVRDGDRPGRVRRHHLDLDPLRQRQPSRRRIRRRRRPSPPSADSNHVVGEEEVDEAGAGDLRALDLGQPGEVGELGGELARRPPPRAREAQRRVRRVVAVHRVARPLQLDGGAPSASARRVTGSAGNGRANRSSSRRSSSAVPTPTSTSPVSMIRPAPASCRTCRPSCAARRSSRPSRGGRGSRGSSARPARTSDAPRSRRGGGRARPPS